MFNFKICGTFQKTGCPIVVPLAFGNVTLFCRKYKKKCHPLASWTGSQQPEMMCGGGCE